jgi:uncharacterized OsmC-like protein
VTGNKAASDPSRIERITVDFEIEGELDPHEKMQIAHIAEEICTISNTLKRPCEIAVASP